jgi:predicted Zn-dependent protease
LASIGVYPSFLRTEATKCLRYIENGRIQYPVKNFRFNQSLMQLLAPGNVEMIGASERVGSAEAQGGASALLPALKIREFHFTSQSEAV